MQKILIVLLFTVSVMLAGNTPKKSSVNMDTMEENLLIGLNSDNAGLQSCSAYMLGEVKSTKAVIPLMKILKCENCAELKIIAALSLYKIGDARGIFAVKQAAKFDESSRVRKICGVFYRAYKFQQKFTI